MALTPEQRRANFLNYQKQYYAAHKEEKKAKARARYKANPNFTKEQRKRRRLAVRKWMAKHQSQWRLKKQEERIGRPRPEVCEVCGRRNGKHGIALDHCHKTGAPRGWLCYSCNTILGHAEDNPEILRKLIDYLTARLEAPQFARC